MNSDQTPFPAEPGGGQWHPVENPGTGAFASKTAGWTADRLSTGTGGMAVDFSSVVPVGTRAVMVNVAKGGVSGGHIYYRAHSDTEISNTPAASGEVSHRIASIDGVTGVYERVALSLSADYKIEIAVTDTAQDISVSYPDWYML